MTMFPIRLLIIVIVASLLIMLVSHGRRLLGAGLMAFGVLLLLSMGLLFAAVVMPSMRSIHAPRGVPADGINSPHVLNVQGPYERAEQARQQAIAVARRHAAATKEHQELLHQLTPAAVPHDPRVVSLPPNLPNAVCEITAEESLALLQPAAGLEPVTIPDPAPVLQPAAAPPTDDVQLTATAAVVPDNQTKKVLEALTTDSSSAAVLA